MTTSVKTCFKCGAEKPLTDYYAHPMMSDGHLNKCKECTKKDTRRNRRKNIGYYREYDLQRYRNNPKRKAKLQEWYARWAKKSPAGVKARNMVNNAIRDGKIVRKPCEVCGDRKSEAHHPDYSRPFDVIWLCRSHHAQWHHKHGPGKNADIDPKEMEDAA